MAALLLILTQCKKKETVTPVDGGKYVHMTLTTDGAKTSFGANGTISWVTGDKVNVVVDGAARGCLTASTEGVKVTFSGDLDMTGVAEGNYDFYFYYVGGNEIIGGETSYTMSMSGQDGTLGNLGKYHICKGVQNINYDGSSITASARMRTYTAVAYVNLSGFAAFGETGENLYIQGEKVYEQVTINFADNSFSKEHDGYYINVGASVDNDNAYYMFIPTHDNGQSMVDHRVNFVNKRTSGQKLFRYGIVSNGWYCDIENGNGALAVTGTTYRKGSLRGLFGVQSGVNARFSQGNLQYNGSNATWQFAANQFDYIGGNQNSTSATIVRDLFGWGATGYNNTATYPSWINYQPYATDKTEHSGTDFTHNIYGYGPGNTTNLSKTNHGDWGCLNITNGDNSSTGSDGSGWLTATTDRWNYMLTTRGTELRGFGNVGSRNIKGLIILPNGWSTPNGLSFTNTIANYTTNDYSADEWAIMEAAGAVFLPITLCRSGVDVYQEAGNYWTVNHGGDNGAYEMLFDDSEGGHIIHNKYNARYFGYAVRLIWITI